MACLGDSTSSIGCEGWIEFTPHPSAPQALSRNRGGAGPEKWIEHDAGLTGELAVARRLQTLPYCFVSQRANYWTCPGKLAATTALFRATSLDRTAGEFEWIGRVVCTVSSARRDWPDIAWVLTQRMSDSAISFDGVKTADTAGVRAAPGLAVTWWSASGRPGGIRRMTAVRLADRIEVKVVAGVTGEHVDHFVTMRTNASSDSNPTSTTGFTPFSQRCVRSPASSSQPAPSGSISEIPTPRTQPTEHQPRALSSLPNDWR